MHLNGLRADGSEIEPATSVALLALPWRNASSALLTRAISSAEVCGAGPCASGICGTADLSGADLSLDLPATFFPLALAVLPAAFADCVLLTPRANAVSVARVTASRLAPASAATSADRYRVCKADCPQNPGDCFAPNLTTSYPPRPGFLTGNAAIFGRKSAAIVAKAGVRGTNWHQAQTPITIRRSASHDCRRSAQ